MQVGRACAELLLIFPDNRLGRKRIIICVRTRNGRGFSLVPTVHQSHHHAELRFGRQLAKIGAIFAVLGYIAVSRIKVNARLYAVNLVRSAAVGHKVFALGVACADCSYRGVAVAVVHDERIRGFTAIVSSVRADIVVPE